MHAAELAELDLLQSLRTQLAQCAHGEATALVTAAARQMQVSVQTAWARLRKVGFTSGRKLRADKCDSDFTEQMAMAVAAILHARDRANGKQIQTLKDALAVAQHNNLVPHSISYATASRVIRRLGLDSKTMSVPDPHVQMKSLHPNHVWQLDASICVLYYLKNQSGLRAMDKRDFNERKPKALERVMSDRVLRYAVTDHTSGAIFCKYYNTAGEDQRTLFEFLMDAMHAREGDVMHGVPKIWVWDRGSANTAHAIKAMAAGLGVETIEHDTGNARAKGQVEGAHNLIECGFEARLAMLSVTSVDELNQHLFAWLRKKNGVDIHTRHKHTRWAVWQTIKQDELRICPPRHVCEMLMLSKPETRVVKGDVMVEFKVKGFDSMFYRLRHIPTVRNGDSVEVSVNPYSMPNIFVRAADENGVMKHWECQAIGRNCHGFLDTANVFGQDHKPAAVTRTQVLRNQLNEAAWGTSDKAEIDQLKRKGIPAFGGGIDPMADVAAAKVPDFMQRRGSQLDVAHTIATTERIKLDIVEILREVRESRGRRITPEENTFLRANWSDGCFPEDIPAVVASLSTPQERPRLAVVK